MRTKSLQVIIIAACGACATGVPNGESTAAIAETQAALQLAANVMNAEVPALAYNALSDDDKARFAMVMEPVSDDEVAESSDAEGGTGAGVDEQAAAANGCFSKRAKRAVTAAAGNTLFTYWQTTKVCAANGRVSSVAVTEAGGETSTPGWRIDAPPTKTVMNASWEGRGNARYHFVLGSGGIDIQHPTRCIQMRLNANLKDYRVLTSCELNAP